jgi:hypothetical protein
MTEMMKGKVHSMAMMIPTKFILPFAVEKPAQQAPSPGIPLFIHDGEECYASLRASLARMF